MEDWKSDVGWVGFYNAAHLQFSQSFKEQFSEQLEMAFNEMTEIANFAKKRGFLILIGMVEMKISYQNDYGFGLLEICTPFSESIPQTFYWKTNYIENSFKNENFSSKNIEFGFCADFQTDYFKKFKKRNIVRVINGEKISFKFIEELDLFPDLTCEIIFKIGIEQDFLEKVYNILNNNLTNSYLSEISKLDNKVTINIDFQSNDLKEGKKKIRKFIIEINSGDIAIKIEQISFE